MRFKHPFRKLAKTHLWTTVKNGLICERCGTVAVPMLVEGTREMQYYLSYIGHFENDKAMSNIAVFYTCGQILAKDVLE